MGNPLMAGPDRVATCDPAHLHRRAALDVHGAAGDSGEVEHRDQGSDDLSGHPASAVLRCGSLPRTCRSAAPEGGGVARLGGIGAHAAAWPRSAARVFSIQASTSVSSHATRFGPNSRQRGAGRDPAFPACRPTAACTGHAAHFGPRQRGEAIVQYSSRPSTFSEFRDGKLHMRLFGGKFPEL